MQLSPRIPTVLVSFAIATSGVASADWLSFPSMSEPHGEASLVCTTTSGGTKRLYMVGGLIGHTTGSDKMEVYDFAHGAWSTIVMPSFAARDHLNVVNAQPIGRNELWLVGGKYGALNSASDEVTIFNLDARRFLPGPMLPKEVFGGTTSLCGQHLIYVSGAETNGVNSRGTYSLDLSLAQPAWQSLTDFPTSLGMVHGGSTTLGDQVYVLGGEDAHNHNGFTELDDFFLLDPQTGQYSTSLPDLPVAGSHMDWSTFTVPASAVPLSAQAHGNVDGYVCFGASLEIGTGPVVDDSFYAFDVTNQVWRQLPVRMPRAYVSPGLCVDGPHLYLAGGGVGDYFNEGKDVHRILLDELFGGLDTVSDRHLHTLLPLGEAFTLDGVAQDRLGRHDAVLFGDAVANDNWLVLDGDEDWAGLTSFNLNHLGAPVDGFSLCLWFRARDLTREQRLLSKTTTMAEQDHVLSMDLWPTSNALRLRARVKTNGVTQTFVAPTGDVEADRWYCAMLIYDGQELRLHLESVGLPNPGTPVGTFPLSGTVDIDVETPTALGANPNGTNAFEGDLSSLFVFSGSALTLTELGHLVLLTRPWI